MKCPNTKCPYSKLEKIEENANFCSKCGCNLSQSGETSSSQGEKSNSLSKNSTQVVSETEDRHCSPTDSIGKSLHIAEKHQLRNRWRSFILYARQTHRLSLSVRLNSTPDFEFILEKAKSKTYHCHIYISQEVKKPMFRSEIYKVIGLSGVQFIMVIGLSVVQFGL